MTVTEDASPSALHWMDDGVPDRTSVVYDALVPKNPWLNMEFRRAVLELGYSDDELAEELWILCARDPLFYANTFCWILETREPAEWNTTNRYGESKVLPFITRDYQDELITSTVENLGRCDIMVPKSRETGISWIYAGAVASWDWGFHEQVHIGFVSKDLLSANNPDDPDALFSKFEFLIQHLPYWMCSPSDYERNITKNTFKQMKNGSSLTAYPAKADLGRGGRKAWFLLDEFHFFEAGEDYAAMDSTVHVTPCRVFVSTANRDRGQAGAFYDIISDDTRNGVQIVIDWKDDKDKRRGLYHGEMPPGADTFRLVLDDADFWAQYANGDGTYRHPTKSGQNYQFIVDDRTRSLYYDYVWFRPGSTPQSVSAELDRNFGGATAQIFSPPLLARALMEVKVPKQTGDLSRHPEHPDEWVFDPLMAGGLTTLWCELRDGRPPLSEYSIGADVSAGTGGEQSSYSALEAIDKRSGEHVFEWRSNRLDPIQFADLAVWVCKWFHNAYLVPEINGPLGQLFINRVTHGHNYPYVYEQLRGRSRVREKTRQIGYMNSDKGIELLKKLEAAVRSKKVFVNSAVALKEAGRYFLKAGVLVHAAAEVSEDGAGVGKAHGDAAIALGAAVLGVEDWPAKKEPDEPKVVPYGCALWRRQQFEQKQKRLSSRRYWSPTY